MDTLESNVRSECKQGIIKLKFVLFNFIKIIFLNCLAFAELQTDMTDLTADLEFTGIPILCHKEYIFKVFFPGVRNHPILNESKVSIIDAWLH